MHEGLVIGWSCTSDICENMLMSIFFIYFLKGRFGLSRTSFSHRQKSQGWKITDLLPAIYTMSSVTDHCRTGPTSEPIIRCSWLQTQPKRLTMTNEPCISTRRQKLPFSAIVGPSFIQILHNLQNQGSSDGKQASFSAVLHASSSTSRGRRGRGSGSRSRAGSRVGNRGLGRLGGSNRSFTQMRRVGRKEAAHFGGVHCSGNSLGVGLVRATDNDVGRNSGSLAIGVGHDLGVGCVRSLNGDRGSVGACGRFGSGLAGIFLCSHLGVCHAIVGDCTGPGDGGGSRNKAGDGGKGKGNGKLHFGGCKKSEYRPLK